MKNKKENEEEDENLQLGKLLAADPIGVDQSVTML